MYFDQLNKQNFVEHTLSSRSFRKIYSKARLKRYREENHCPDNDLLSKEGIWFMHPLLMGTKEDIDDIVDAFLKIYENRDKLV